VVRRAIEAQDSIADLVATRQWDQLRDELVPLHPSDVAEVIIDHPTETEGIIFRMLPKEKAARVFSYLPPHEQRSLLQSLSNEQVRKLLDEMTPDDRTHLLEEMPAEVTRELLLQLDPPALQAARELLGYPENTAGRYMTPEYAWIYPNMTAAVALDKIRQTGRGKETLNWVYVLDADGKLLEDLRLANLVLADANTNVLKIDDPELVSVRATDDRDAVLKAFRQYDRTVLPVTDNNGYMLGIITVDDVLDIAEEQATEDIQKLGGSEALGASYTDVSFRTMLQKRGGWLAILFLGEMLTATAMSFFEAEIARAVVLALFVPLIISSGGNSGSQATSLVIRALALRELRLRDWWKVCGREIAAGVVLGTFLGGIGFLRIVIWQRFHITDYGPHYLLVAATVSGALIGVVSFGTLTGSMLPFVLRRLGFDPATASAPFVATLVDVTGLCIYFGVALLMLRGTLL
jgi:magnesium transporter